MVTRAAVGMALVAALWLTDALEAQAPVFRLAWDQVASTAAEATSYVYEASLDGAPLTALTGVTCMGAVSPFLCVMTLPPLASTAHTIAIRAVQVVSGQRLESPVSPVFGLSFARPTAPQNLRILSGPGL